MNNLSILSKQFLHDIGIEITDEHFAALSEHFNETLSQRIITEIIDELSPEQAEELANFTPTEDAEMYEWLKANIPDLKNIIEDEIDILLGEMAQSSEMI